MVCRSRVNTIIMPAELKNVASSLIWRVSLNIFLLIVYIYSCADETSSYRHFICFSLSQFLKVIPVILHYYYSRILWRLFSHVLTLQIFEGNRNIYCVYMSICLYVACLQCEKIKTNRILLILSGLTHIFNSYLTIVIRNKLGKLLKFMDIFFSTYIQNKKKLYRNQGQKKKNRKKRRIIRA